jgi:hypothetical protein
MSDQRAFTSWKDLTRPARTADDRAAQSSARMAHLWSHLFVSAERNQLAGSRRGVFLELIEGKYVRGYTISPMSVFLVPFDYPKEKLNFEFMEQTIANEKGHKTTRARFYRWLKNFRK